MRARHRNYMEEHTSEGVLLYEGAGEGLMPLDACKGLQHRRDRKTQMKGEKKYVEKWMFLGNI